MRELDFYIGHSKWDLDTPCLTLDRKLLQQNLLTMQAYVKSKRKNLRPHVKTHKCSKIAKLQLQTGSIGISCAKISEAMVLIQKNVRNILITSPITTPEKIDHLINCFSEDPEITVVVDNLSNAQMLNEAARSADHSLNVLVDIDPNVGRTGVSFYDAIEFAKSIHAYSHLAVRGVQCYAGNIQHIKSYSERKKISQQYMRQAGEILTALQQLNLPAEILTGTGTGTYDIDCDIPEVTEIQPGSYIVMDADYFNIESASAKNFCTFKPALTLLSTVISNNHPSHVTLDAGLKALYLDNSRPLVIHPANCHLEYEWGYGDEHGKLLKPNDMRIALNTKIELMVSHCDPTMNLFDHLYITQDDRIIDIWPIDMRGKSQ
ncbi:MAG: DSD1 family PLP-dependent enzyme [Legionellales bacterium]|nr:DSD1 family PLP-dependent enzyme [Legionellales bacterium]